MGGFFFSSLFYNFFLMATYTLCVYRTKAVAIGPGQGCCYRARSELLLLGQVRGVAIGLSQGCCYRARSGVLL